MQILTFDIGGTLIKSAMYDENLGLLDCYEHEYPRAGVEGVLAILRQEIRKNEKDFDAIGISTAGLVDAEKGEIIFCSDAIPGYTGTLLKAILESETRHPVFIMNDVNAAALGEGAFGSGKDFSNYVCLTYGTSIGGAIVIDDKIYGGKSGYAGEIGHIVTHLGGKSCVCGRKGCYTEYASVTALLNKCRAIDYRIRDGFDIFANFENPHIKAEIDMWIDEVVHGLTTVCHIFDPEAIILGGGIMKEKYLTDEISRKLRKDVMPGYENVAVLPAALGNKAGLMGAAENVLRHLKND
ncbi:MAG: ROK family protein [Clostridia bacterium]|nr:ROK family protein [Clostridia bacterium]